MQRSEFDKKFFKAVENMRGLQKRYFKGEKNLLEEAKIAERIVDSLVQKDKEKQISMAL